MILLRYSKNEWKNRLEETLELYFRKSPRISTIYEENELGFHCTPKESKRFDLLPLEWKNPAIITNAIVEWVMT